MADANATGFKANIQGALELGMETGVNDGRSQVFNQAPHVTSTGSFSGIEWRSKSEPDYHVYVFNISERTFRDIGNIRLEIPGLNAPGKDGKSLKQIRPGMETMPFRLITSFPQPMLFPKINFDSNQVELVEQDVRRFVVSIISPDMASSGAITLDNAVDPSKAFAQGCDLARSGVFFDYSPIPSEAELKKAYARLEKYYEALLERARTLGLTNKSQFEEELKTNPDYQCAAAYSGDEFDWYKKSMRATECLRCGERVATKKPFHRTSDGLFCVEPTVDAWKQLYNMGQIPKDRIPEDFQWFKDDKNKSKT